VVSGATLIMTTAKITATNRTIRCFPEFSGGWLGWCQDNRNKSNQESKFDFLATWENGQRTTKKLSAPIKFTRFLPVNFVGTTQVGGAMTTQ